MKIPTSDEEERKKNMRSTPGPMLNPSFGVSSGDGSSASSAKSWDNEQVDRHLRDNYPNVHHERGRGDRDRPQDQSAKLSRKDREDLAPFQAHTTQTRERAIEARDEYQKAHADREHTRATGKVNHPETGQELHGMQARIVRFQQDGRVKDAEKDYNQSVRYYEVAQKREASMREGMLARNAARAEAREAQASGQATGRTKPDASASRSDQLRAATQQSSQQSAQAQERTQTQGQKRTAPTSTTETSQTTSQPKSNASANPSDRLRNATQHSSQQSAQAQTRAANAPARGQDDEHRRR